MDWWDDGAPRRAATAFNLFPGRAGRLFVTCALALLLSPLFAVPAFARSRERSAHVKVLFSAAGKVVTASGTVSTRAIRHDAHARARLQQRVGSHWRTRATGSLTPHGRLRGFSLSWDGSAIDRKQRVRVEIVAGHRVLAVSAAHTVKAKSPVSVQSTLRASTVQPPEDDVVSVSAPTGGDISVVLAKGARIPAVGAALVLDVSAKAPQGVLGLVTAVAHESNGQTAVMTKPATLEDAYSSFDAHLNGSLGELSQDATEGSVAKAASVNLDPFAHVSFGCSDPSLKASITHNINLSGLLVNAEVEIPSWGNGFSGPGVLFSIGGQPKLNLGVKFAGGELCEASVLGHIPIPSTPLMLEIGPDFTVGADGAVGVELEWTPRIFYGFSRFRGKPSNNWRTFKNGGRTKFTGNADLRASFALEVGLSLDGAAGIRGSIGPEITGRVTAQSSPPQTCLSVNADFAANLEAFASDFFEEWTFTIGSATFGHMQLYHKCTASGGGGSSGGSSAGGLGGPQSSEPAHEPPNGGAGGLAGASRISSSAFNTCALLTTGHVECWGANASGQLGDGSTAEYSDTPVEVLGITDASALSSGSEDTCALLTTGHVECWGSNFGGQLGDGSTANSDTPVEVLGIT